MQWRIFSRYLSWKEIGALFVNIIFRYMYIFILSSTVWGSDCKLMMKTTTNIASVKWKWTKEYLHYEKEQIQKLLILNCGNINQTPIFSGRTLQFCPSVSAGFSLNSISKNLVHSQIFLFPEHNINMQDSCIVKHGIGVQPLVMSSRKGAKVQTFESNIKFTRNRIRLDFIGIYRLCAHIDDTKVCRQYFTEI